eukprot:gnl/Chilomastix_cuspidata/7712.p1 GENE.gnl/Chilomastix_cuspidata/7712~~gnl/Chilomastix_cuspidata/7712.p1  ORF type:complete len:192 (-),score=16.70 gnl/Chilomastix_cuspidata/7712:13-588(-)
MMRKLVLFSLILVAGSFFLFGCAPQQQPEKKGIDLPMWVLNPTIEGGIASTECVVYTGDISLDKAEAVALARASLAKQIEVKVKAMDKTYQRKVKTKDGVAAGGVFESVSKQVAQQYLKGARAIKMDLIDIEGKKQWCVMVAMDPSITEKLFKNLVKESGANLDPQDESVLYEEFKAYKAGQELDEEIEKM